MQVPSSLSTRLQYQHKCLVDLIDGLSEELIRRPVQAGKWSVFEHIVHLQTYQHTFISRVRQILEGNEPTLDKYTAEADPLFASYRRRPRRPPLPCPQARAAQARRPL